jgi:RNA polymerase sigma-70 factor (ECF subfamily)
VFLLREVFDYEYGEIAEIDGGGKARGAATRPLMGVMAVAQFILASTRLPIQAYEAKIAEINGEPAAVLWAEGKAIVVIFITMAVDKIHEIRAIANPDKLTFI